MNSRAVSGGPVGRRLLQGSRENVRAVCGAVRAGRRRGSPDHLLHVRLPLRHQRSSDGRQDPLHRGQPRPPGQQGGAVRQGLRRHHAALRPGAAVDAASQDGAARFRRVPPDLLGRGARAGDRLAGRGQAQGSQAARLLHRARPVAVADRFLGPAIRHPELRRPWRLLLGQHGGCGHHDHRRCLLGVRGARLGAHQALRPLRRRRGP